MVLAVDDVNVVIVDDTAALQVLSIQKVSSAIEVDSESKIVLFVHFLSI